MEQTNELDPIFTVETPIVVSIPNTSKEKMSAIVTLSEAIKNLAIALNSVQVITNITNCNFNSISEGSAISIVTDNDVK